MTVIISDFNKGFFQRKESDFVYKIDELIIPQKSLILVLILDLLLIFGK